MDVNKQKMVNISIVFHENDQILIEYYIFWLFIHYLIIKACFHLFLTKLKFCQISICVMTQRGERVPHFLGSELGQWPRPRVLYWYRTPLVVLLDALRQSRRATSLTPSGVLYQYRLLGLGNCSLILTRSSFSLCHVQWELASHYLRVYILNEYAQLNCLNL